MLTLMLLSLWLPLFWRKTSLKTKQRERVREAHIEESLYSKEARRHQIKADKK